MYYRRPAPVRRSPEVIAAEKAAADAKAMTCQVCGRRIFAETGRIAHHGYERPGTGWQTASCFGARQLPFEVYRGTLKVEIDFIHRHIQATQELIERVEREDIPLAWTYSDKTKGRDNRIAAKHRWRETTVSVTRETFAEAYETFKTNYPYNPAVRPTFDGLKEAQLNQLKATQAHRRDYLKFQQARYDGWKMTHRAANAEGEPTWVKL